MFPSRHRLRLRYSLIAVVAASATVAGAAELELPGDFVGQDFSGENIDLLTYADPPPDRIGDSFFTADQFGGNRIHSDATIDWGMADFDPGTNRRRIHIHFGQPGTLDMENMTIEGHTGGETQIWIYGSEGDDKYFAVPSRGQISLEGGNDYLRTASPSGPAFGGDGFDTVDFSTSGQRVVVKLKPGTVFSGNDTRAVVGFEAVIGTPFDDTLKGSDASELFDGGPGPDDLEGLGGDDSYVVDDEGDVVVEADEPGIDTVTSSISFSLSAQYIENLTLTDDAEEGRGNKLDNRIVGSGADNRLFGLGGHDRLSGRGGDDFLVGGNNADYLDGGEGSDILNGGKGPDVFDFDHPEETAVGKKRDVIEDFSQDEGDRIDLRTMDADTTTPLNQKFHFIRAKHFSGTPGQLRYRRSGSSVVVEGDVDGDGAADFAIRAKGDFTPHERDFEL